MLEGNELFEQITGKEFSENQVCRIVDQILRLVNYIHTKGYAILDLKPENIWIDDRDEVKLIDLANIQKVKRDELKAGAGGTIFYMAPEVFSEGTLSKKIDIWSVGIIMFILMTKKSPFFTDDDSLLKLAIINRDIDFLRIEESPFSNYAK